MTHALLEARDVKKYFPMKQTITDGLLGKERKYAKAVDGVSLSIGEGEVLALVGESGSGKTTFGKLALGVYPATEGSVLFEGTDIASLGGSDLAKFRMAAQMVYQDPVAALNPRISVGEAIREPLGFNKIGDKVERKEKALRMMKRVGLDPPEEFFGRYPHELSGGQRQRVVIARSLILTPRFVVADEPVAMLDVSVRAQILKLVLDLKREMNLTLLVITHDLAIAKDFADTVAIMYLGRVVEIASRQKLFKNPLHPYTKALFSSVPIPDPEHPPDRIIVHGDIPSSTNPPAGCRFHTRCPFVFDRCKVEEPKLMGDNSEQLVACHLYDN